MKLKIKMLLTLLAMFSLVSCNLEEVQDQLEENENFQEYISEEEWEGEEDEEDEFELSDEALMTLRDLSEEEITEFKLCIEDVGEVEVGLDDDVLALISDEEEDEAELYVHPEACDGTYSIVINGYYIEAEFEVEIDEFTTGEDILEGLFEHAEDCDHDDDHDDDDEDEVDEDEEEEDDEE